MGMPYETLILIELTKQFSSIRKWKEVNVVICFAELGIFINPILAIIICVNLVTIIEKVKNDEDTSINTIIVSLSLAYIVFTISILASS